MFELCNRTLIAKPSDRSHDWRIVSGFYDVSERVARKFAESGEVENYFCMIPYTSDVGDMGVVTPDEMRAYDKELSREMDGCIEVLAGFEGLIAFDHM